MQTIRQNGIPAKGDSDTGFLPLPAAPENTRSCKGYIFLENSENKASGDSFRILADTLRNQIIRGDLPPGQRLKERDIAQLYAISRTPVRDAFKLLSAEGLIILHRNRGAEVASFPAEEAQNLFQVIAEMEALAARLFVHRITSPLLTELEDLHEQVCRHHQARRMDAYFAANTAVHEHLITHCGNPILIETHAGLSARARLGRHMALLDENRWDQAVDEHEQMMTALRSRDASAVAGVWRRHLLNSGHSLTEVLK